MAAKEPLFEGSVTDLLKEWFASDVDKHFMDKGNRKIVIYAAPKAWELLNENGSNQNGNKASNRS